MLKNEEGYKDPTPQRAINRVKVKTSVLREAQLEQMDAHRPHAQTLDGWSEAEEQELLIKWAGANRGKYPALHRLFHIPNGGQRHPAEATHLKKMGVKAGVPDLFLPFPCNGFHGLWVEMKSLTGRPTALQLDWLEFFRKSGYAAFVCVGFEAARDCIVAYMEGEISSDSDMTWQGGGVNYDKTRT